jgi:membrane-associated phospholipid phosphatase
MFQTAINYWLQSFSSSFLDQFMILITDMGYEKFFILIVTVVLFGINFRKGFYLTHILIINSVLINIFKNLFALPRPSEVDNTLKLIGQSGINSSPFSTFGAKSFFGLPSSEVINYYRHVKGYSYGLPSGHVCSTTVMWGSIYFLFRRNVLLIISIVMTFLMAISRMYLAKHFLGDVTGGFILGIFILIGGYYFVIEKGSVNKLSLYEKYLSPKDLKEFLWMIYLLVFPFILLLIPSENIKISASLLGINLGYLFLIQKGIPSDDGILIKRVIRVLLALIIFTITQVVFNVLLKSLNAEAIFMEYLITLATIFLMMVGTVKLGIKFKLYEFNQSNSV